MISVRPYTADLAAAVRDFNRRLHAGEFYFPQEPQEHIYLAVEDGFVRGGYMLRPQCFFFRGEPRRVAHYRLPLSEGIVNRAYTSVGVTLLRDALRREPLLYALGMGGVHNPLPRMLRAAGWRLSEVPFFYKVLRPFRFLRGIEALRKTPGRRALMDAAAFTGLGAIAVKLLQPRISGAPPAEAIPDFAATAGFWESSHAAYGAIAARDPEAMAAMYPPSSRIERLRVGAFGWAAVLDTPMQGDKYFGDLRLGSIADCLAPPANASAVIRSATRYLEQRGVDLIVSNQLHTAWAQALRDAAFREGPSNFAFAASKRFAELAAEPDAVHINRGDGDGPIHL